MNRPRARWRSLASALLVCALLSLYIVVLFGRGVALIQTGELAAQIMGVFVLLLPVLGIWVLYAEIRFGVRSTRIFDELAQEGPLPTDGLPVLPSGRPDPKAAALLLPELEQQVEQHPDRWRHAMRLALALDASGDRRAARRMIVNAIRLR